MKNNFIIDTPKLQTLQLKYTSTLLTLAFWVIWFYLWVPLITLAGWWFQIRFFQQEMIVVDGLDAFLELLPIFAAVTFALTGTLGFWALYNYKRFKGADRRKPLPPVQKNDLIELLPISESELNSIQSNKISTVVITKKEGIIVSNEV
ncbi:MAG: poly-beta-1,6-N-acetyl-D-glucosamine biosynthesis protein PgaD [Porticoccaceae bacterium]|nr:poly-beta-1,6-N-acetyl-D-glucosamine biosynthesis protein PgaD [Porticoccaceae bacterium]